MICSMFDLRNTPLGAVRALIRRSGRWSPSDRVFLPLAGLLTVGLITLALNSRPDLRNPVYTANGFVMQGDALGQLVPGPGTRLQLIAASSGESMARLSAIATFKTAGERSAGVSAALSPQWEARVAGRMLRVEVEAQTALNSDVDQIRVGYFTIGYGDSGRTPVALERSWRTVGICFRAPENAEPNGQEAVGVWPGDAGSGDAVLVREIRITIEPEDTSLETCQSRIGAEV